MPRRRQITRLIQGGNAKDPDYLNRIGTLVRLQEQHSRIATFRVERWFRAMSVSHETSLPPDQSWSTSATFKHQPAPIHLCRPRMADVVAAVCAVSGLPLNEIVSRRKQCAVVEWRSVLYFLCAVHSGCGLNQIAKILSGRNHTTISSGIEKVEQDLESFGPMLHRVKHHMGIR